jgi:hypothetical protein
MARVGSTTIKENSFLNKMKASDKVQVLEVNYKEKHTNVRLVPRSGRRNGNNVYIDIIKIPTSVKVQLNEDQSTQIIYLGLMTDVLFQKYLDEEINLHEYHKLINEPHEGATAI